MVQPPFHGSPKTGPLADALNSAGRETVNYRMGEADDASPSPPTQPRPIRMPKWLALTPRTAGMAVVGALFVGALLGRCGSGSTTTSQASSVFAPTPAPLVTEAPSTASTAITTTGPIFALWAPDAGATPLDLAPGIYTAIYRWGDVFVQLSPGDVWLPAAAPALAGIDLRALPMHPDYKVVGGVQ
jgi:hypothetical protein